MRITLLLLLASTAALGTVSAAPVPKDGGKPVLYFPTEVGTKFAHKDETGGEYRREGTITAAETKDGVTTTSVEWKFFNKQDGEHTANEKLAVSAKGVFRVSLDGTELDPPMCLLKLPAKKGEKWDTSFTYGGTKFVGKAVAGEPEEVKTPAGDFTAIPVEYEYTLDAGLARRMTCWYAPHVGLVQKRFTGYRQEPKLTVLKALLPPKP